MQCVHPTLTNKSDPLPPLFDRLSINSSDRSFGERAGGQQPSSAHSGKVTGGGQIQSKGMRSPMFSSGGMLASPLARSTD